MKFSRKNFSIIGLIIVITVFLNLVSGFVSYKPISGVVIDSDSGLPLKDVIVVAIWKLQASKHSISTVGVMKVQEVSTNEKGEYLIPAWFGFMPGFFPIYRHEMHYDTPELYFFKRQYHYGVLYNRDFQNSFAFNRGFKWDGITIKLRKAQEIDYKEMLNKLFTKHFFTTQIIEKNKCIWVEIPKFINETKFDYDGIEITLSNDRKTMTLFKLLSAKKKCPGYNDQSKKTT